MRVAVPTGENVGYRGCVVVVPVVVAHVVGHRWPGARLNRRASAKDDADNRQRPDNMCIPVGSRRPSNSLKHAGIIVCKARLGAKTLGETLFGCKLNY